MTFFPRNDALENLLRLSEKCERVIIIDNTPEETPITFPSEENITVKKLGKNRGLSFALNHGMKIAKSYQIKEIFIKVLNGNGGFNVWMTFITH